MKSVEFVKKIKNYAVISFLVPLITINICFLIFSFIGNMKIDMFANFNWDKTEHVYTAEEYNLIYNNPKMSTFWSFCDGMLSFSCPKTGNYESCGWVIKLKKSSSATSEYMV